MNSGMQMQLNLPRWTMVVKRLIIANVVTWVLLVVILQNFFMSEPKIFQWFGFVPMTFLTDFWVWQAFTYMFLHSENVTHILFNMLVVWLFGSDLELKWGSKKFFVYYMVSGVGAAVFYLIGTLIYSLVSNQSLPLAVPMVGASGATYGLMLAYGVLFGDRVIHFMGIFPMKARIFVLIIGTVQLVTLLSSGLGSQEANLAHLGGLAAGGLYLFLSTRIPKGGIKPRYGRRLKLVVDNDKIQVEDTGDKGPKYWN